MGFVHFHRWYPFVLIFWRANVDGYAYNQATVATLFVLHAKISDAKIKNADQVRNQWSFTDQPSIVKMLLPALDGKSFHLLYDVVSNNNELTIV